MHSLHRVYHDFVSLLNRGGMSLEHAKALIRLREKVPDAVIAGGALRDLYTGIKPVKDFDIALYVPGFSCGDASLDKDLINVIKKALYPKGGLTPYIPNGSSEDARNHPTIIANGRLGIYDLIFRREPFTLPELLNGHDVGATMIGTTGKYVYADPRFLVDVYLKRFTVYSRHKESITQERLHRWREAGYDWPIYHSLPVED